MEDIYDEIVRIRQGGEVAALATIIWVKGSTPRAEGTKMLVRSDGSILGSVGGGCLEADVWQAAMKVIEEEIPKAIDFDLTGQEETAEGLICGGTMQVFIEPILSQPTIYLFGAGHIGFALSRLAKTTGFRVAVIDDRPAYANAERFPDADDIYVDDPEMMVSKLKINKASYLVIACRGHLEDQQVLAQAVKTPAVYIGMIGSKKKVKTVFTNLKAEGIPQETLDGIYTPIGLRIAAETPEEIAVSIMAEIISVRRQKNIPRGSSRMGTQTGAEVV
ncbi:XdhC family protein [Chloroflexota bacterium]